MTITEAAQHFRSIFPDRKISCVEELVSDPDESHTTRIVNATVFRAAPCLMIEAQFRGLSWRRALQDARDYVRPIEIGGAR